MRSVTPLVSIILPTRDRAYALRQTLDGIRAQTFSDWELVLIDDGSKDGTRELIASYADTRFHYLRNESPLGAAKARNQGLAKARAEFIAFQDAGDDWLPEKLALQVERLRAAPANVGMVYTSRILIYQDGTRKPSHAPTFRPGDADTYRRALGLGVMGIDLPACLFRAAALRHCGGFDEALGRWIDLELFIRLAKTHRFDHVEGLLTLCPERPDAITMDVSALVAAHARILEKYAGDLDAEQYIAHRRVVGRRLLGSDWAATGRRMLLEVSLSRHARPADWAWLMLALGGRGLHRVVKTFRDLGWRARTSLA